MRLTYCFAICLVQIISYANGDELMSVNAPASDDVFVYLKTKKVISRKDSDIIHAVVTGRNLDGRPFHGKTCLVVVIKHDYNPDEKIQKFCGCRYMDNGVAEYNLNMTEYIFEKYNNVDKNIQMIVSVTEKEYQYVTLKMANIRVYSNRYNLERCVSSYTCSNFSANVEQDVIYRISHVNGSYVNDTKSIVELTYSDIFDIDETQYDSNQSPSGNPPLTFTGHMNETGCVHFKVTLPVLSDFKGSKRFYVSKVRYLDEESIFSKVHLSVG